MPQNQPPPPADALRYLRDRLDRLEAKVVELKTGAGRVALSRGDHEAINAPYEGEVMVNHLTDQPWYYSRQEWRPFGSPGVGIHEIKVVEDGMPVEIGDDAFVWEVPEDLDGALLFKVAGFHTVTGSGPTEVDIKYGPPGGPQSTILEEPIIIPSGEYRSMDAPTQPEVTPDTLVFWGDYLHIDIDAAADGATGLGVHLIYTNSAIGSVAIEGATGPPGGVDEWTGAYDAGDTYVTNQAVSYGGTTYVAITNVTAGIIPGVTPGWEDYWHMLVQGHEPVGAMSLVISGNGYPIDPSDSRPKGYLPVPFDCEIIEATLLGDVPGSCVVDLWKDTYGNHPPTDADSITAGTPLTLVSENRTVDAALTGWTTTLTTGEVLAVVVESLSAITILTVALRLQRP